MGDGAENDVHLSRRGRQPACMASVLGCRPPAPPSGPCALVRDGTAPRRTPVLHVEVVYGASVLGCRLGRPPAPPSGPCALVRDGTALRRKSFSHVEAAYAASVLGCRLGRPAAPPSGPCALVRDGTAPRMTSVLHVEAAYLCGAALPPCLDADSVAPCPAIGAMCACPQR